MYNRSGNLNTSQVPSASGASATNQSALHSIDYNYQQPPEDEDEHGSQDEEEEDSKSDYFGGGAGEQQ